MKTTLTLKQHNILDYVHGATVAACPEVLGLDKIPEARNALRGLGLGTIGYSLFTNYDYSVAKLIPLGVHMAMDVFSGLAVMAAPFVLGYHRKLSPVQLAAHFVLGFGALGVVAATPVRTEQQKLDRWAEELEQRFRLAA